MNKPSKVPFLTLAICSAIFTAFASASSGQADEEQCPYTEKRRHWLVYLDVSGSQRTITQGNPNHYEANIELTAIIKDCLLIEEQHPENSQINYFAFANDLRELSSHQIQIENERASFRISATILPKEKRLHTILGRPLEHALDTAKLCPNRQFTAAIISDFVSDPPHGEIETFPKDFIPEPPPNLYMTTIHGPTQLTTRPGPAQDAQKIKIQKSRDYFDRQLKWYFQDNYKSYELREFEREITPHITHEPIAALKKKWLKIASLPLSTSHKPTSILLDDPWWYCGQQRLMPATINSAASGFAELDPCALPIDCPEKYLLRGHLYGQPVYFLQELPLPQVCGATVSTKMEPFAWYDLGAQLFVSFQIMTYGTHRNLDFAISNPTVGEVFSRELSLTNNESPAQSQAEDQRQPGEIKGKMTRIECNFTSTINAREIARLQEAKRLNFHFRSNNPDFKGTTQRLDNLGLDTDSFYRNRTWRYINASIISIFLLMYFKRVSYFGWASVFLGLIPFAVDRTPDIIQRLASDKILSYATGAISFIIIYNIYKKFKDTTNQTYEACAQSKLSTTALQYGELFRTSIAAGLAALCIATTIALLFQTPWTKSHNRETGTLNFECELPPTTPGPSDE